MKINKNTKIIIGIFIIAIIFISGYLLYNYIQRQNRINSVNDYKRGFYEGMLCEYNCPLTAQEYKNKTQMLPDISCVRGCTQPFKTKFAKANYTIEELENDNLLKDIDDAIKGCKSSSVNLTTFSLNNAVYFKCAADRMNSLKLNYDYLNK